jgi:hypothetical protein
MFNSSVSVRCQIYPLTEKVFERNRTYAADFDISGRSTTLDQAPIDMSGPLGSIENLPEILTWTGSLPGRGRAINMLDVSKFQAKLIVNQDAYLAGFTLLSGFKIARGSEGNGQKGSKDSNDAHIEQESD